MSYVLRFNLPSGPFYFAPTNAFNLVRERYWSESKQFDTKERAECYLALLRSVNKANGISTVSVDVVSTTYLPFPTAL